MFDINRAFPLFKQTIEDVNNKRFSVDELQFRHMIQAQADYLMAENRKRGGRMRYTTAEGEAYEQIVNWYLTGHEYMVKPFDSSFIGSHCRACVWAVYLRKEHTARLEAVTA